MRDGDPVGAFVTSLIAIEEMSIVAPPVALDTDETKEADEVFVATALTNSSFDTEAVTERGTVTSKEAVHVYDDARSPRRSR